MNLFGKSISWQLFLLVIAILIVGVPSLFVDWMIVDDGYYLLAEQKISSALLNLDLSGLGHILVETDGGRFRPGLWLFLWFTYLLAGKSVFLHHLINFLISASTVFLIYSIIKNVTSSKSASLMAGLLFIMASFNLENWYRLNTPEPKITLFIALSIYFLIKALANKNSKRISNKFLLFSLIPLVFAYFTREISFAFIAFPFLLLAGFLVIKHLKIEKKTVNILWVYAKYNFFLFILPFLTNLNLKQNGYYTSSYQFSPAVIQNSFTAYLKILLDSFWPVLVFIGILFFLSLVRLIKAKKIIFERLLQFSFLISFLSFLVVLLPWGIPMPRYLETSLLFLVLFMGIEVGYFLKNKNLNVNLFRYSKLFILTFIFLLLMIFNGPRMYNYAQDTIRGQRNIAKMLSYLASNIPENGRIYWNISDREWTKELVMQINLLLNNAYVRPDLKVEYLDENKFKQLEDGDIIMSAIIYDKDKFFSEEELLNNRRLNMLSSLPHEVNTLLLNTPTLRETKRALFNNSPLPERTFIGYRSFKYLWRIYKVYPEK